MLWQAPNQLVQNCWKALEGILQAGLPVKGAVQTEFRSKPVPNISWQFHCEHKPYWISVIFHHYLPKVNRCLARYSPRTTTTIQPTKTAPNKPGRPICAQESIFWVKNGCFRPNSLIMLGGSKSSGTHTSENHWGTLFTLFYWLGMAPKGSYRPIFGPKWPQMHILGQIWSFSGQKS